jgi:thiol-disulfide isomerase/thioredoxin
MKGLLFFLPVCLAAQTGTTDLFSGTWINVNAPTSGVTQFTVRRDGGRTLVHVWGACQPLDCDWGEAEADSWNGIPLVIWKQGFAIRRMQLVAQPDGRMVLVYRSEYQDGSGRTDQGHAEFFLRQEAKQDSPDTAAAKALLKAAAETYRALRTARFESIETVNRLTGKSEIRQQTTKLVLFSAPNHARVETRSSREESIAIDDGASHWEIFPKANEYTRIPQAKDVAARMLPYSLLDAARGTPRVSGNERFEGAACTIVQMDLERGVKRELWIDDATHLVRKDLYNAPPTPVTGVAENRQIIYSVARPEEKSDAALFTYDPAATNARDRQQLRQQASASLIGSPAPELGLRDLNGAEVRIADLHGKVVLLDFWGTWCGYCREALPSIELLHRAAQSKGLAVLGIDAESAELARDYLAKYGYTFPSLVDSAGAVADRYRVNGWPTTVLIDRAGNVAYYAEGMAPEKLRDALLRLGIW